METNQGRKINWTVIIVVGIIVAGVVMLAYRPSNIQPPTPQISQPRYNIKATIDAYNKAKKIAVVSVREPDWTLAKQGKFDEYISAAFAHANHLSSIATDLRAINAQDVDPAVSDFILTCAELFDLATSYAEDNVRVGQALKQYDADYNSAGSMLEAFLRGIVGDPFGKSRESITAWNSIKAAITANQELFQKMKQAATAVDQKDARVQAYLTQEYHL